MSDPRTDLANALTRLEAVYDLARQQLQDRIDAVSQQQGHTRSVTPEQMLDDHGRYILLDALTAIVQARTALVNGSS